MTFAQFVAAYDDIVARARTNKLQISDFEGTTISLTNPGTVGTIGSVPRLMPGQGAIVAIGAIDFPAEFAAVSQEMRANLGISKTLMITCTYDHRIIQGAESGSFLARMQQLLQGEENFYDAIFRDLKVPYRPLRWQVDQPLTTQQVAGREYRRGQRSRGHSAHQRLPDARPLARQHQSAGHRPRLPSGSRSCFLRSDYLGSRSHFSGGHAEGSQRRHRPNMQPV